MRKQLLILLPMLLVLSIPMVEAGIALEEYPTGTYNHNKDSVGDLVSWKAVSDNDFTRWSITARQLTPAFGDCSISTDGGFIEETLRNQDDETDTLDETIDLEYRIDVLFDAEILSLEQNDAFESNSAYTDSTSNYICYKVHASFADGFLEKETPEFIVKIYEGAVPVASEDNIFTGSMIFVLVFMVGILAYLTFRDRKR